MDSLEFCKLNKIKIHDNVLSKMEVQTLRKQITEMPMTWTGRDAPNLPVNTLTKSLLPGDAILDRLQNTLFNVEPKFSNLKFSRAGINFIMPQLQPSYFHFDGPDIITCLFYITPNINIDDGGETQFDLGEIVLGIKPKPGRICIFDGLIGHRTTYFRDQDRITIYLKYYKSSCYNIFNE